MSRIVISKQEEIGILERLLAAELAKLESTMQEWIGGVRNIQELKDAIMQYDGVKNLLEKFSSKAIEEVLSTITKGE